VKLLACFLLSALCWAQDLQPNVINAKFEARPFSGDLRSQLRANSPTWFGYAAKSMHRSSGDNCCNACRLEHSSDPCGYTCSRSPVPLEGSDTIALLFRVENDTTQKIEVRSLDCSLDAGGLPFIWLRGVPAATSASFLKTFAAPAASDLANTAIFAISQHADPAALSILEDLARPPATAHVRGQAIFWLAQRAGERAASFIEGAIQNDPDTEVKKKAVFALSQLPRDEGVPKLIQVAQQNRNPEVRKQAFFWLGQSNDARALAFIEQVLAR
jgi:HEAT repeats